MELPKPKFYLDQRVRIKKLPPGLSSINTRSLMQSSVAIGVGTEAVVEEMTFRKNPDEDALPKYIWAYTLRLEPTDMLTFVPFHEDLLEEAS